MRYFVEGGLKRSEQREQPLDIITTLYGPPPWATVQKTLNGRDLDPAQDENLAVYLIDWVQWLKKNNYPVKFISLHNEGEKPHGWAHDGYMAVDKIFDYNCFWPPQKIAEFINFLREKMNQSGLDDIGVTPGEASNWSNFTNRFYDYYLVTTPGALDNCALITSHGFGGNTGTQTPAGLAYIRRARPELKAWVTSCSWGREDSFLTDQMILGINNVKINAIIPWAVCQVPSQWYEGVDCNPAPPVQISEDGTYEVKSTYYYYKHFTRSGKRGMAVAPVALSQYSGIDSVAFAANGTSNPDSFILVNSNRWATKKMAVTVNGSSSTRFTARRSWRKYGLKLMEKYNDIGELTLDNGMLFYEAPPDSVTTFFGC
jgi:O-glycosyl hydrolase